MTRFSWLVLILVSISLGACDDTWRGVKKDTGENLEKTGEALDKAGEDMQE